MNKNLWILGILVLCILLLFSTSYEGFVTCGTGQVLNIEGVCVYPVKVKNSKIRQNNTCSDPRQQNVIDRFDGAVLSDENRPENVGAPCTYESKKKGIPSDYIVNALDPRSAAAANYEVIPAYYGMTNLCLPKCDTKKGYTKSPNDDSLCVSSECQNTADLSSNILDSWRQVCGPFTKTEHNLTSTINSISNVTDTLRKQFSIISSNVNKLSNGMYSYIGTNNDYKGARGNRFPNILSNYNTLNNAYSNTNIEYESIQEQKSYFDTLYNDKYYCDRYQ